MTMQSGDYYEILQISPKAEAETIHRVYRILAQRYHPDNGETGNGEVFREIIEAYQVLSDPARRAEYDTEREEALRRSWKIVDLPTASQGFEIERRKRDGILSLLYRRRLDRPDQPALSLHELEGLLGVSKDQLEFSLWFLKEGQYVSRTDNARYAITLKGVQLAESAAPRSASMRALLAAVQVA
jgi:curved DNA-binding protein CbpA